MHLEIHSVVGKLSDIIIINAVVKSMKKFNTEDKIVFCSDNTTNNFVGAEHNGTNTILSLRNKNSRNIPGNIPT